MERILIAVDFSEASRKALEAGAKLARALGAEVVLVHAFDSLPHVPAGAMSLGSTGEDVQGMQEDWKARQVDELSRVHAARLKEFGLEPILVTREGEPEEVIASAAEDNQVQLIVVGSHGRKGFKRFVLGSVAQSLLHQTRHPVLVVPAGP